MSRILEALRSGRVVLMDGAMGSELLRAGLPPGQPCESWNLTHPERVRAVHRAYAEAGSDCLLANTFLASPEQLGRHGLADRLEEIIETAIALAREAAGPDRCVLASVGPLCGERVSWTSSLRRMLPLFKGADGILFETWSDLGLLAVLRDLGTTDAAGELPWLVSFAYRPGKEAGQLELACGASPGDVASACPESVTALGINCGRDVDLEAIAQVLRVYRERTRMPLLARPNAGTPHQENGAWCYSLSAAEFARQLPTLLEAGASLVGGCCGTTPAHIKAARAVVDDWNRTSTQRQQAGS